MTGGELDRILVVDDEPIVLDVLTDMLTSEGYDVARATSGPEALDVLESGPFAVLMCDIRMPGMDGFELVRHVRRRQAGTDVLMMTGFGSIDGAIEAMSLGAADYLIKPLKPKEVLARIRSILEKRKLEAEVQKLQAELRDRNDLQNVVAKSERMAAVLPALHRIATSDEPAFITGERGSGRRFLGRAIHYSGGRRDQALNIVRCDLLNPEQAGVELFGASSEEGGRRGALERFAHGTVQLHEVECLPRAVQSQLARTLERRALRRVGESATIALEARVLMSTRGSLAQAADRLDEGLAALDLSTVHVPSLAERTEDLPGLVDAFLNEYERDRGQTLDSSPEAIELLAKHEFRTNVAELFAILGHCATLSTTGRLEAETIERAMRQGSTNGEPRVMADHLGDREFQLVQHAVNRNPGRLDQAARELGVSRTTLWRRMRKYGIKAN